ncbi:MULTISPECIES: ATP-dependent DNA ligase [Bradyrhizobium]|uniref:DNA ligase (ATP) n=2 Tax=Bradyrhizobium TaxID=374 RepID=A0AAE7TLU3_9BRAD|nr:MULTISPECIES: ATP-dependent DNA ligase [Bradyrhizobium]MCS3533275.1 ATP-dependent DNA ligase [Bradyrhizobium japonicum]MCS3990631.1 ATP-dependent DNA ligase [Bradyrhizobium japonicum]MCS4014555.1 ATP-dependent DNA ligase [Bradyrhizobium japonicum]MCS4210563.1 ATP-dependent DNA ligase [Bradyrhizobium japonicum]MCW2220676.1 ATP-dependent DNA ligase [Bradyrhizobium japonicum]
MQLMEAESVAQLPRGAQWQYEPKWDGFRCLLIRERSRVSMQSKSGRDLVRYFPEIAAAAAALSPKTLTLDGELIIELDEGYSFDALLQRIHPAASRVKHLAKETPATFMVFDLLRSGARDLSGLPLMKRRAALETLAGKAFQASGLFRLTPASRNYADAEAWLNSVNEDHDGVVAKRLDLPYRGGTRDGMQKIKLLRSADCVVGGFRYAERKQGNRKVVGSLLLGLYDKGGLLHHVGFTSGIRSSDRLALTDRLEKIVGLQSFTGNSPGGPSRWSTKRSAEWKAVRPTFVVEVSYDHVTGDRFRHGTKVIRWRPDKKPSQCRMDQLRQRAATQTFRAAT